MFCEQCGRKVADNALFCESCGTQTMAAATPEAFAAAVAKGQTEAFAAAVAKGQPDAGTKVIRQDAGSADSIDRCPSCGSSDIGLNIATGLLRCNFCRSEWAGQADGLDFAIDTLQGITVGSGATDIADDSERLITMKCTACGAEVVIDTEEAPQARCHWCRNTLSLNHQVPNGAVPDAVLPFKLTKARAQKHIAEFVEKRRHFAHPQFKAEFGTENIMGVYLPYMVVDINARARFRGQGERLVRQYTVGTDDNKKTYYDADLYSIGRDFDLLIDDLTIEASSDKLNQATAINSNNIINSVLPYPMKKTVRFNANYLRGFTSEKRDVNRGQVESLAMAQARDIARWHAKQMSRAYDRGIRWDTADLDVKGQLWKTVYLPIWLYSYLEVRADGSKFLHYVATNAVTGETMALCLYTCPNCWPQAPSLKS
jgi:ribosomal protein L37AE/L43A